MSKFITGFFVLMLLVVGFGGNVSAADKNCGDFNGDADAIAKFWVDNGYSADNDPHDLDRDNDGLPCEADQAAIDKYKAQKEEQEANAVEDNNDTVASTNDNSEQSTQNKEESSTSESDSSTNSSAESVSAAKEDKEEVSAPQGEELPKTATNNGALMMISFGLVAAGILTLVLKKKQRV
ncbi:LPXTG cell wall anchor domain-containing protein [Terribacillus saccharophilus]|uniref:LPXTG cell wall anchor domain-containing protein n=1 Tax=Terribacillus saccharophilus TaxID=361277 RepID=UPI0039827883